MKETVKKGTVFEKVISEMFINGKDTVSVLDIDELKGHTGSAFHGILVSTGRTKTTVTAEQILVSRNEDSRTWYRRKKDHHNGSSYRYFPSQYLWDEEYI